MTLTTRILIAMVAGIVLGSILNFMSVQGWFSESAQTFVNDYVVGGLFDVLGRIFVASLKMLVVPLVFVSLACGASNLADGASMGRLGGKTVGLYLLTTCIAITLALSPDSRSTFRHSSRLSAFR